MAWFGVNQYTINAHSDNDALGTVEGGGTYDYGTTITLIATPIQHYHFSHWSDGSTENPRSYQVEGDINLTAYFAVDRYTVTVSSSDPLRGSVEGGGIFTYLDPVTISATAYSGYQFVRWSNGVGHNPYTFAVTADMDLVAVFIPEGTIYNITAVSENPSMGTVTGGGPYGVGERAELTAIPEPGYQFDRWSDGSRQNPRTVVVSADATYVAYFVSEVGIDDTVRQDDFAVWTSAGSIRLSLSAPADGVVYDIMGRRVATVAVGGSVQVPAGIYLVRLGHAPARKVVVIE